MNDTSMMACERFLRKTHFLYCVLAFLTPFCVASCSFCPCFEYIPLDLAPRFGIFVKKYIIGIVLLPYGQDFTKGKGFYHMRQ
jgi:hypothetical protein